MHRPITIYYYYRILPPLNTMAMQRLFTLSAYAAVCFEFCVIPPI